MICGELKHLNLNLLLREIGGVLSCRDPNQEYFAEGMTDELITMLAKDSTLRITSRTSVLRIGH